MFSGPPCIIIKLELLQNQCKVAGLSVMISH